MYCTHIILFLVPKFLIAFFLVNKSRLTNDEERRILQIRQSQPNLTYVQIAERMPGRTALIIKNFIYRERDKERKSVLRIRQKMSVNYIKY